MIVLFYCTLALGEASRFKNWEHVVQIVASSNFLHNHASVCSSRCFWLSRVCVAHVSEPKKNNFSTTQQYQLSAVQRTHQRSDRHIWCLKTLTRATECAISTQPQIHPVVLPPLYYGGASGRRALHELKSTDFPAFQIDTFPWCNSILFGDLTFSGSAKAAEDKNIGNKTQGWNGLILYM